MTLKSADVILGSSTIIVGLFFFLSFQSFAPESAEEDVKKFEEFNKSTDYTRASLLNYCHAAIPPDGTVGWYELDEYGNSHEIDEYYLRIDSLVVTQTEPNYHYTNGVDSIFYAIQCLYDDPCLFSENPEYDPETQICSAYDEGCWESYDECTIDNCPVITNPIIECFKYECLSSYFSCLQETDDQNTCFMELDQCEEVCREPYVNPVAVCQSECLNDKYSCMGTNAAEVELCYDHYFSCRETNNYEFCEEQRYSCMGTNPEIEDVCSEQLSSCEILCFDNNVSSSMINPELVASAESYFNSIMQIYWDEKSINAAKQLQEHPTKCPELRLEYLETTNFALDSVIEGGIEASEKISLSDQLLTNTTLSMSLVITVFSFSAVSESIISYRRTEKSIKASAVGFISFIVGFIGLASSIVWFAIQRMDMINIQI